MNMNDKRQTVEQWLDLMAADIDYAAEYGDRDAVEDMQADTLGLVHWHQSEVGTVEWEYMLENEGWVYHRPTDAQVNELFDRARAALEQLNRISK